LLFLDSYKIDIIIGKNKENKKQERTD